MSRAPRDRTHQLQQPASQRDEFASVFNAGGGAATPAASSSASASSSAAIARSVSRQPSQPSLSEEQLFERIELQLEDLDRKRLALQQLVRKEEFECEPTGLGCYESSLSSLVSRLVKRFQVRSLQDSPYSTRLARNLDTARVDAANLARKVHNLFRHVALDSQGAASASAAAAPVPNPSLLKFQPLFLKYAEISRILNMTCMQSIRLQEEIAAKSHLDSSRARTASSELSSRRKHVSHSLPNDSSLGGAGSMNSSPSLMAQESTLEDMPLLEVHGLERWDAARRGGDYMHLSSMVADLAAAFHSLQQTVNAQQPSMDLAENNIAATKAETFAAESDIRQASRYKAFGLTFAGGLTGAALGGPLGALMGVKAGLGAGVGIGLIGVAGGLMGATVARQVQKARFVPMTHEEEGKEMQRIQSDTSQVNGSSVAASAAPSASGSVASTRSPSVQHSAANSPQQQQKDSKERRRG
jgi:outer membrane lipoprotein SlyB